MSQNGISKTCQKVKGNLVSSMPVSNSAENK